MIDKFRNKNKEWGGGERQWKIAYYLCPLVRNLDLFEMAWETIKVTKVEA